MDKKKRAGEKASEFVQDGMVVGLGTGSTAYWATLKIGERVKNGLNIRAIPTSVSTAKLAAELGIPLIGFGEAETIDLTIDGADEIDPGLNLIKGGGGALLREKIVAQASREVIIVAEDTKRVEVLGAFQVPVEIVPFGWEVTLRRVNRLGGTAVLRSAGGQPFETDNGNWILDCDFGRIPDPATLHQALKMTTGAVETGIFPRGADRVVIATEAGVELLRREG
ncbi:ribose-5-phosphate isomerase RpiA [Cohnella sp. CFH 77786]|uniref:ribose-5-phosphate isomerase RpiA n=1 Tax=Cohnella sp. CFH 77786 TaxID=2662265 RepID=UPI001C609EC9|nr:ribose-5-phosphate isomerase RpiA [Cohnella sp. CFH 77786]MBW5446339.1 ribose-5-phosphate isomerase RpiA [Cohnella sp. CFH 77786]